MAIPEKLKARPGEAPSPVTRYLFSLPPESELHNLFFLLGRHLVNFFAELVGEVLHPFFGAFQIIFCNFGFLFEVLQLIHGIAADGTDGHLGLLPVFGHVFHQVLAAFLGQRREVEPQRRAGRSEDSDRYPRFESPFQWLSA